MNRLLVGAVLLVATPVVSIGLLAGAYSASGVQDGDCSTGLSSTSTDSDVRCGPTGDQGPARAFHGPDGLVDDPTSSGRITRRMLHTYNEVQRVFHDWKWSIGCWDPHLWNPTSDHPLGRACDFTVGHIGALPTATQRAIGWQLAHWAQANAGTLGVTYIIFDGHIWSIPRAHEGWRRYNGGGIYDPTSVTGGHYDHLHISVDPNSA